MDGQFLISPVKLFPLVSPTTSDAVTVHGVTLLLITTRCFYAPFNILIYPLHGTAGRKSFYSCRLRKAHDRKLEVVRRLMIRLQQMFLRTIVSVFN